MVKKIVIAILCFTAYGLHAQNSTISPYSFFGVGDQRSVGTVENQMMGGLSMYTDSIHISLRNPAAIAKLRLTTYSFAGSHREFRLKSFDDDQRTSVTNFEYLVLGFPIGEKFGASMGLAPFSSVGYSLLSESNNSNGALVTNQYTGEGGLNRAFISMGYKITKNLNIGVTGSYSFGTLENQRVQSVEDVQFGTLDDRSSRINGYDFNYGLTYTPKITNKHTLFTSVTVNTQANLSSSNAQRIGSFSTSSGQDVEVIDVDLEAQGLKHTELKIPTTTAIGLGYGQDKKWFMGAEYTFQKLSTFTNEFINAQNLEYEDRNTIAVGGFYIPDYASFTNYFKKITYRAGIRYDMSGMLVNGTAIDNFGITFGLGLPLGGSFSNLNLGFEVGRRGTTSADLIEESYFKVNIGLSLNQKWFLKRKIN